MQDGPGTGIFLIWFVFAVAVYVYFAFCLQTIANKTNNQNGWMGWVPILNIYLMCQIAGRPGWWVILILLIPIINIILSIIVWMDVAKARNKPGWLGILMIIPFINFIIPGYIAFAD